MYSIIISGGSGTRLWPLSRASSPKQLLPFIGSKYSLLQNTYLRMLRTVEPAKIRIVTNRSYDHQVLAQIQEITPSYPPTNLLSEPVGKDSAPAILWGALRIASEDPEAVAAVVWSDHLILNDKNFDDAMVRAGEAAKEGGLFSIGVKPTFPSTGLGYIKAGREILDGIFEANRFIEKPELALAEQMLADGGYSWNAGIFVFNLATLIEEFERFAPNMIAAFRGHGWDPRGEVQDSSSVIDSIYGDIEKDSIDYAILEKTDKLRVIPCELDWSDLGTWDVIYSESPKDENGNSTQGNVLPYETKNSYIRGGKRLITTIGVEHLIIVDTDDALLVCDMSKVQDVKNLVTELQNRGFQELEESTTTVRPWGSFTILGEGPGFKVKTINVKPHQKLSLQMHHQRAEHWMVLAGDARATRDNEVLTLSVDDHLHIPAGAKHRLENPSDEMLTIVEVQFGGYLGEDDIVRFEDSYGRV